MVDGNYDERLTWSEYNGFLWCAVCNEDYPSALCHPLDPVTPRHYPWEESLTPRTATDIFLDSVQSAVRRALALKRAEPRAAS